SRSLAACEGAVLLVDAGQGVEAQTLSNLYLALGHDLEILPVINKIDLPSAQIDEATQQLVELLGCKPEDVLRTSAKTGAGVRELLEAVIRRVPPPTGEVDAPTRALISTRSSISSSAPWPTCASARDGCGAARRCASCPPARTSICSRSARSAWGACRAK